MALKLTIHTVIALAPALEIRTSVLVIIRTQFVGEPCLVSTGEAIYTKEADKTQIR